MYCEPNLSFLMLLIFFVYRELLNVNWKKPDREMMAPNVCHLIRRTNEVRSKYACLNQTKHFLIVRNSILSKQILSSTKIWCYIHTCTVYIRMFTIVRTLWLCNTLLLQNLSIPDTLGTEESVLKLIREVSSHQRLLCTEFKGVWDLKMCPY